VITSRVASTISHPWRSDIFSVWAVVIRPLIRNLREGASSTDHKRHIPRWVERTGVSEITRAYYSIPPSVQPGMRVCSEQSGTHGAAFYGGSWRRSAFSRKSLSPDSPRSITDNSGQQIGGGVISDVWRPEERGRAISLYLLAPLLGPVVGPLAGAWITQTSHWRWIFWGSTLLGAAVQAAGVLLLDESQW